MSGSVIAIHIASQASVAMQELTQAIAVAGAGLDGDRYRLGIGFYPPDPDAARQLTLIEAETLDALLAETGIELLPRETRRNVTTRGISLDTLLGKRFAIGEVICQGVRPCPPCTHLEDLTGRSVMKPLLHRGGLRAAILSGGTLRVGDPIQVLD